MFPLKITFVWYSLESLVNARNSSLFEFFKKPKLVKQIRVPPNGFTNEIIYVFQNTPHISGSYPHKLFCTDRMETCLSLINKKELTIRLAVAMHAAAILYLKKCFAR